MIKATYNMKIDFTCKSTFALKPKIKTMLMPIKIMQPPRAHRTPKPPDLTKETNLPSAEYLEELLVYPSMDSVGAPSEIKPIELPGGHYRLI